MIFSLGDPYDGTKDTEGSPFTLALVCEMGTVTISPTQCWGDCEEKKPWNICKIGRLWWLVIVHSKAVVLGALVGRGTCHSPDETLHGENVLRGHPKVTAVLTDSLL